jgi:broad specificity phosphatase PhoE
MSIVPAVRSTVTVIMASLLAAGCNSAPPTDDNRVITVTLVRHGQSEGNASGIMDTSVPGPPLTKLGSAQALMVANRLAGNTHDGVFASSMLRTQQTAEPTAAEYNEEVTVLPGLREIEAGQYEGEPESVAGRAYYADISEWVKGERSERIPGAVNGDEFDARFDEAIESIYNEGDSNPVVFSHGAAIAAWTMMNVNNPDPSLMATSPLPNTGWVVVSGSPQRGWTLEEWNGLPVG